jgi:hypothetical protein
MSSDRFDSDVLDLLRAEAEVRVLTSRGAGSPGHSTIIWIVVDEADRVLVRSVRGPRGRWYRECVANPACGLVVADREIATNAEPATDPDRVEACSRALRAKYARWGASLAAMLVDETLETTLELRPRPAEAA